MCGGGGGQRATITEPDYKAMDMINEKMFQSMAEVQDNPITKMQGELNNKLAGINKTTEKLRDEKVATAKMISSEEARITAMLGTPLPSESAKAPVMGESRTRVKQGGRGRASMRSRRSAPLQLPTGRA